MCAAPVRVPVMPRASQRLDVVAAALRHAFIFAAASEPLNRSAFCTRFKEFTAALPFTSRLNCGFVVFTPREVAVNRWTDCIALTGGFVSQQPVNPVSVKLVVDPPETNTLRGED